MPIEYSRTFDDADEFDVFVAAVASDIWVELEGASGATGGDRDGDQSIAGAGGYVEGNLPDAAGETITIRVGGRGEREDDGGGFNGGGSGHSAGFDRHSGGGGGASDIRIDGDSLDDRVAVAGGGGGTGSIEDDRDCFGGDGGGLEGEDGSGTLGNDPGEGGTQTEGGDGINPGSFGEGGDGDDSSTMMGPGGGGGWYGGGGGNGGSSATNGGGGGSSFIGGLEAADTVTGAGAPAPDEPDLDGEDGSVLLAFEIDLDAIDDIGVAEAHDTALDLEWTVQEPDADGQRLYRSDSPGVDPEGTTELADLGPDVDEYTDGDLDNATTYYYLIETYAEYEDESGNLQEVTSTSNELEATTLLPDPEGLELDGSERAQIQATWEQNLTSNGMYRLRWKRSNAEEFDSADETTLPYDETEYVIEDTLDGESYDVEIRTEVG